MNSNHANLLGTAEWAAYLHGDILPVVTQGIDLGGELLEIGPGPGAAIEWLRHRVRRLVAVELKAEAAAALKERFDGLHHFHEGDTYNPVDPAGLLPRLQTLGFGEVMITVDERLMFRARKPTG